MVNVNLNGGGNVIISKSAEPSRPGGRERRRWPLYILSVSGRETEGMTANPIRRIWAPPRPRTPAPSYHPTLLPNSVSTCRLIKVLRIEEFVWETWSKSMSEISFFFQDKRGVVVGGGGVTTALPGTWILPLRPSTEPKGSLFSSVFWFFFCCPTIK